MEGLRRPVRRRARGPAMKNEAYKNLFISLIAYPRRVIAVYNNGEILSPCVINGLRAQGN
jgi:hypothetical protein